MDDALTRAQQRGEGGMSASKRNAKGNTPGTEQAKPGSRGTASAKAKAGKATRQLRQTGMSTNLRVTLGVLAIALGVLIGIVVVNRNDAPTTSAASEALVRPDSHRLSTAADGKTTVVEFLDFECESCLAAYPGVEKLRAEYGDRITYVVRYFPIASHPNAFNAAHAAEAAARQGKFEQMYKKLFDNQNAWGHTQQSQAAVFAGYARELGLDMTRYSTDVDSAEVAARVKADATDGENAGVQGTPTFFINGEKHTDSPTYDGLKAAIDASLTS